MGKPKLVVNEEEFIAAAEFFGKLHPETQRAALSILASNIEEGRKSQSGGAK